MSIHISLHVFWSKKPWPKDNWLMVVTQPCPIIWPTVVDWSFLIVSVANRPNVCRPQDVEPIRKTSNDYLIIV